MLTYCYSYTPGINYYSVDCEPYTTTFPIERSLNHLPETGPKECSNCQHYGSFNGVFVCYCVNCATKYKGTRGPGVLGPFYDGEHLKKEDMNSPLAAMNSYMKGIKFSQIGDKDFCDSVGQNPDKCFHFGTMLSHFSIYHYSQENDIDNDCSSLFDDEEPCYDDDEIDEQDLYEEYDGNIEDYSDF